MIGIISICASAQNLFPDLAPIYKDDVIARVDITIPADSLAIILAPGNEQSDYYFHATFLFDNGTIRDTFVDAGLQLRGNTSRYAQKKSFQVSLNTYSPGRSWYGVDKINLNGEHNDPTVSRSKIGWDLLRDIGVPAPRSSHVELYINGTYYGLYVNVEHIDDQFVQSRFGNKDGNLYKCLWPADMVYLGSDPDLYKLSSGGRRVYELKTNETIDDYSDLALLIDVLNNTPINDLPCALESIFNVNTFLKAIAFDILSGNWDGSLYNKNNFYLYHNQATGLFEYIPYDLDNTFGIDWFGINWAERNIYAWGHPDQPRPLYWRILMVPEYKDRLSFYMHTYVNGLYKENVLFPEIDSLKTMLAPSVAVDDYYTLDYGFSIDDFYAGFGEALPYPHTPIGVKQFISQRRSATIQQLQLNAIDPIISMVNAHTDFASNETTINAYVQDDLGLASLELQLQWNGTGPVDLMMMYDDGAHGDNEAGDGWYGLILPPPDSAAILHYTIKAVDLSTHEKINPVCGDYQIALGKSAVTLAINEFMASNTTTVADESGEYEDWVEIYNYGNTSVYLGDYYLSDKSNDATKWSFPDQWLEAGQYLLIWLDEDQVQGPLHANFKLSAGGEFIGIFDSDANHNTLIDGLDFDTQETDVPFGRYPDGTGPFMKLYSTPGSANQQITAVADVTGLGEIKMYPNPVGDVLVLQTCGPGYVSQHVLLQNAFGQVVAEKEWEPTLTFSTTQFSSGIYLVSVRNKHGISIIGTVIKQ